MKRFKEYSRISETAMILELVMAVIGCILAFAENCFYESGVFFGLTILCRIMPDHEDGHTRMVWIDLLTGIAFIAASLKNILL